MSLFRRLQGHRKNHQHHGKDDLVEMSTSASDGNSPEKQQDAQQHKHKQHSALHLGSKNSKQKTNGVQEGDNNTKQGATSSAPLTPQQQPPPPPGSSASKRSGRSLFKKRRHRGVSKSPTRVSNTTTASKEDNDVTNNDDKKNGGKEDYNNIKYGGGGGIHLSNFHATTSAHLPAHHLEDGAVVAVAALTPSKTPSRNVVNHLPPTPEAVPLIIELQFPTDSATPTSSSTAAAAPTSPKSGSRAPTTPTPRKSKATSAASLPTSPRAAAAPASSSAAPAPLPPPRSALADVAASYAEKSARLAAHKAHWWSLFSHPPHRRHKKKRNNGSATTTAAAASLPPRSSPRYVNMSRNNNSVYSPTSASSGSSPQHVLIVTDIDSLNNPDYRNKIAKEAAALDKEGNEFFQQGNYDDAFLCYEKAMTLKRQSLYVTNQQIMKEGEQEDQGDDNASVASQVTVDSKASILASVATSINNMTYLKQRAGLATAEETMAAYLKSLQIKRDILGPNHLSVGKTLNNIGSVFYIKREFEPALKAYQSAHEIMAAQLGAEHLDVGTVISNIGDVKAAMETGDGSNKQDAMEYYRRALDIRWKALGPNDPKVIRLMEQLAWLETGKQPQKLDEELSDSEDEEFATEDRKRHEAFQEDVRVLQEELAEDMKFFDLLERKMAIDMVKDKTRCFRELRELQEELELSASRHGAAAATAAPCDEETTDNTDGSDAILTTVSAPPNMAAAAACDFQATSVVKKIGNFVDRSHNNNNSDQQQHPSPSLSSFWEKADAAATATPAAAGSSPSGNKLTDKERKEALTSVRARLAALRASRDPDESDVTENDDDDDDDDTGKLSVSVNAEDNKKYDGNEENSDWLRKQQTQVLQQYPGSPSSTNALEEGLEELTREIDGGFRTSTSPVVLSSSSLPVAPENADYESIDDDECSHLQSNKLQKQEPGNNKEERQGDAIMENSALDTVTVEPSQEAVVMGIPC